MTARPTASDDQPELNELFAEYLIRIDRGETIDAAKFLREHDDYAEELRELIDADQLLRHLRASD